MDAWQWHVRSNVRKTSPQAQAVVDAADVELGHIDRRAVLDCRAELDRSAELDDRRRVRRREDESDPPPEFEATPAVKYVFGQDGVIVGDVSGSQGTEAGGSEAEVTGRGGGRARAGTINVPPPGYTPVMGSTRV